MKEEELEVVKTALQIRKPTTLQIRCKRHVLQKAVATFGGTIYCEKCQVEFIEGKNANNKIRNK